MHDPKSHELILFVVVLCKYTSVVMIRNHKSGKWVRYNSPHYRKLLKQQEETGEKIFLKKDIRHLNKTRVRTGGGDSENERRDAMIRQMNEEVDNRCNICYRGVNDLDVEIVVLSCKHAACRSCLVKYCKAEADQNKLPCVCPWCKDPITGPSSILPRTVLIMYITVERYRGVGAKVNEVGARAAARAKRAVRAMRANNNTVAPENTDDTPKKFKKMDYIREKIIDAIYEQLHEHIEKKKKTELYKGIRVRLNKGAAKVELAYKYMIKPVEFSASTYKEQSVYYCTNYIRNYKMNNPDFFNSKEVRMDEKMIEHLVFSGELHNKGCDLMVSIPIIAEREPSYSGPHMNDYVAGNEIKDDLRNKYITDRLQRSKNANAKPIITHYPTKESKYPVWTVTLNSFYAPESLPRYDM